jgi:hypothetical protein
VLGFAESVSSHCWTIGLIIDEMLHGKRFFKAFNDILSHRDNYSITDPKFKQMTFLVEMARKNQKSRICLGLAKRKMEECL